MAADGTVDAAGRHVAGVTRYEDLRVWQEARQLCAAIHAVSRTPPWRLEFGLRDQLQGASVSTVANVAEGFSRGRRKEFVHFLRIAAGSNGETRALLYIARDRGLLPDEEGVRLLETTETIGKMLRGLIHSIERS